LQQLIYLVTNTRLAQGGFLMELRFDWTQQEIDDLVYLFENLSYEDVDIPDVFTAFNKHLETLATPRDYKAEAIRRKQLIRELIDKINRGEII